MTNVVEIEHPADPSPEELAERHHFNVLFSDYLQLRSRLVREDSDEALDVLIKQCDEAIWRIIHTPTPCHFQLGYKFEIMREIADGGYLDDRHLAMIESIYSDTVDHW